MIAITCAGLGTFSATTLFYPLDQLLSKGPDRWSGLLCRLSAYGFFRYVVLPNKNWLSFGEIEMACSYRTQELTFGLCVFLLAWWASLSHADTAQQSVANPAEIFSTLPPIGDIALSPDGSKAVVLKALADTYHVAVVDLETGKSNLVMAADPKVFLQLVSVRQFLPGGVDSQLHLEISVEVRVGIEKGALLPQWP